MSLESGRSLGRTASLINIITPAIMATIYVVYFLSIFSFGLVPRTATSSPTIIPGFFGIYFIALIALGAVAFAGFIMFLLAMYRLSRYYNEPSIFNNILYAVIIGVVGGVTLMILAFAFLFASIASLAGQIGSFGITQFFLILAVVIVIALVIGIVNGVLYMRALSKLAEKSGVESFRTAGILYLVGVFVPFIAWVAWILFYIGFGKLRPRQPVPVYTAPSQSATSYIGPAKRCPNCGADNTPDALYCRNCGKPI